MDPRLQELADLITQQTLETLNKRYPWTLEHTPDFWLRDATAIVKPGTRYTRVDVGMSGRYMVDAASNIYGIKAYGVIHRGRPYGTLDTIHEYYWGGYVAVKKAQAA